MKWFTLKSIRTKIGIAILGLVAALVGATVTLFKVGLDTELLSIEDAGTKRDSWLFEHTVEQEFVKLEQALQAWAKWDDLLNFFHSPQDAFLDANFTYSALSVTGSDFALIGRPDASTMFSTQLNHTSQNTEQFNPSLLNLVKSYRELFSFSSLEGTVKGFLRNNDKLSSSPPRVYQIPPEQQNQLER
jgi:sensor domain CHASE-containing protein